MASKVSEWLLERAIRRLCPENQERYREEWKADLDAKPNSLIKLLWALGCYRVADRTVFLQDKYDGTLDPAPKRYVLEAEPAYISLSARSISAGSTHVARPSLAVTPAEN